MTCSDAYTAEITNRYENAPKKKDDQVEDITGRQSVKAHEPDHARKEARNSKKKKKERDRVVKQKRDTPPAAAFVLSETDSKAFEDGFFRVMAHDMFRTVIKNLIPRLSQWLTETEEGENYCGNCGTMYGKSKVCRVCDDSSYE